MGRRRVGHPPGREGQVDEHLIQLPVLARNGIMNEEARSLGGFKVRSALCLLDDGLLVYGELASDSVAPLVDLMTKSGCSLVVSTDRGSRSKPSLEFIREEKWLELPPLDDAGKKPEGITQLWILESGLPSTFSVRSSQTEAFELAD